ncbi:hypothetical protein [Mucilaginibacter antarcticus]|uniref:Uncharacterized protein n=1 Tax=Mucilaginibacter antarcticus TaxID=1855725 RepID=A0ABW5XTH8_9SPHI
MQEFDKGIAQIAATNASEINGDLNDYFTVSTREDGTFKIKWEKAISTHIRHKVTALVKQHYAAAKA